MSKISMCYWIWVRNSLLADQALFAFEKVYYAKESTIHQLELDQVWQKVMNLELYSC
jgi:hypothetical protein